MLELSVFGVWFICVDCEEKYDFNELILFLIIKLFVL